MASKLQQIDSTIAVVTPENIAFEYELAGPFRRCPAFIIDLGVRFSVWIAMLVLASVTGFSIGAGGELMIAIWFLVWFVLEWFYGGLLETYWNGQTIGKRVLGLRVLRIDGQPINGLQAVMRNLLRLVDMMPLVPITMMSGQESQIALPTCLLGLLTPLFNRRYQRLGDLVCGTMVVVESANWRIRRTFVNDPQVQACAEELPASLVASRKMSQALATYVERRRVLAAARREEIARHLADPIKRRWNLSANLSSDTLLCAIYYRTFLSTEGREELATAGLVPATPTNAPAASQPPATAGVAPVSATAVSSLSSADSNGEADIMMALPVEEEVT